ncbi:MAG: DNA-processing protein DprA [Candidatus Ancaeobacter aquaticus]|nr:DNA-processing protein DprA [Candidatus Ancaeobacter aquaticus]
MERSEALLVLNAIDGLGSLRIRKLIEEFETPERVLAQNKSSLMQVSGIGDVIAGSLIAWEKSFNLEKELDLISSGGVAIVSFYDESYPAHLKEIYDPPIVLYVKGQLDVSGRPMIGVVGSRWASVYGKDTAKKISADLSYRGFIVVSGLARGIDTNAHQGALNANGSTYAVLGNGLSTVYPRENKSLADKIICDGALISEFPMETIPDKKNFPRRNRIISGLSLGVVVVEAAKRSGALITARYALEHNRTVCAVPGRIDIRTSEGTNELIKDGAKVVTHVQDIVDEFEYILPDIRKVSQEVTTERAPSVNLTENEEQLFRHISEDEISIDTLIQKCGIGAGKVLGGLLSLELKNLIRQLPGKQFVRI